MSSSVVSYVHQSLVDLSLSLSFRHEALDDKFAAYQNCAASTKKYKIELAKAQVYQMDGSNSMQKSSKSLFKK